MGFTGILTSEQRVMLGWILICAFGLFIWVNTYLICRHLTLNLRLLKNKYCRIKKLGTHMKIESKRFLIKLRRYFCVKHRNGMRQIQIKLLEVVDETANLGHEGKSRPWWLRWFCPCHSEGYLNWDEEGLEGLTIEEKRKYLKRRLLAQSEYRHIKKFDIVVPDLDELDLSNADIDQIMYVKTRITKAEWDI